MNELEGCEWRKSPKHILREACIADSTRDWPPGRFAEMGAGTATTTRAFLDRGFRGFCYDIGDATRARMRTSLAPYGDRARVVDTVRDIDAASCDYVFAFEVLEHIDDDRAALDSWLALLKPGGRVLFSVPAHQRKFSRADKLVGHVRRYEKEELSRLLASAGVRDVVVRNYGFPLGNVTRRAQLLLDRRRDVGADPQTLSIQSGVKTSEHVNRVARVLDERTLRPFVALQRRFYGKDLGDGYVATGRLP